MALALPGLAMAQQSSPSQPSDAPPKLQKLEEGEPPSLKIGKPNTPPKVTEKREGDKVRVDTGKSTYYVRPDGQVGYAMPGDGHSTTNRGVEWKVKEFDLGSKTPKKTDGGADDSGTSGGK